jgi:hypothetical protein
MTPEKKREFLRSLVKASLIPTALIGIALNHFGLPMIPEDRVDFGVAKPIELPSSKIGEIDKVIEAHSTRRWDAETERDCVFYKQDINGDGVLDVVEAVTGRFKTNVSFEGGGFRESSTWGISGPSSVGFDDVDRDGSVDAWCCDRGDATMRIFWGNGKGRFWRFQRQGAWLPYNSKAAFYDLDGDGKLDIVVKSLPKGVKEGEDAPAEYQWIELMKPEVN